LPGLASSLDPPSLGLLSSWDYRRATRVQLRFSNFPPRLRVAVCPESWLSTSQPGRVPLCLGPCVSLCAQGQGTTLGFPCWPSSRVLESLTPPEAIMHIFSVQPGSLPLSSSAGWLRIAGEMEPCHPALQPGFGTKERWAVQRPPPPPGTQHR
jgi:hypothetical protein